MLPEPACQPDIETETDCEYRKEMGWCHTDRNRIKCAKTCGYCGDDLPCEDSHDGCPGWASNGGCENGNLWMSYFCRLSCGTLSCESVTNKKIVLVKNPCF